MTAVAFAAYVSSTRNFEIGQTVIFDSVITNVGGAYDPVTATFTAPLLGTYLFTVTIKSSPDISSEAHVSQNSVSKATVYSFPSQDDVASITTILECQAGDVISVIAGPLYSCYCEADYFHAINHFCGALI